MKHCPTLSVTGQPLIKGLSMCRQRLIDNYFDLELSDNQQVFLNTGDIFSHVLRDSAELEFQPLEKYCQSIMIRSVSREIMAAADQFSTNSQLSIIEAIPHRVQSRCHRDLSH